MKRSIQSSFIASAAALVATLVAAPAFAGNFDFLLKIDGVQGEVVDKQHGGEIRIEGYNVGGAASVSQATGRGGSKVTFTALKVKKATDKLSPQLFLALASGKHFKSARLTVRKATSAGVLVDFFVVTLKNVTITSMHLNDQNGNFPMDELSLHSAQILVEYRGQGAPTSGGWDINLNQKLLSGEKARSAPVTRAVAE